MQKHLHKYDAKSIKGNIQLSSSKSESNRVLLMSALAEQPFDLKNLSNAKDTQTMLKLLSSKEKVWDVMEAGTTMRFCTSYLALKGNNHVITGTDRMKERPIGVLVKALKELGADIEYLEKDGYPPLKITGIKNQFAKDISIPGNISSQFISALLMIAPALPQGLSLTLTNEIFSRPYIEMTLTLMRHFGISYEWKGNTIQIEPQPYQANEYTIESDWSGASYWYVLASAAEEADITLQGLKKESFQGDHQIAKIMDDFGVITSFENGGVRLQKAEDFKKQIDIDFKTCPDLAQGVMVAAALKGIRLEMTGLETLRIKETDRIAAMQNELSKINCALKEQNGKWILEPGDLNFETPLIETYEDHRMAMAFGPLVLVSDLKVHEPDVVNKSYPGYWNDLQSVGIEMD